MLKQTFYQFIVNISSFTGATKQKAGKETGIALIKKEMERKTVGAGFYYRVATPLLLTTVCKRLGGEEKQLLVF